MAILNELIDWIQNPVKNIKFIEFKKAIYSIDDIKIVDLLEGWGKKYFADSWKEYLEEVQKLLTRLVVQINRRIK